MTTHTAIDDDELRRSECWCCGTVDDSVRMVQLGNHPEVVLCVPCGRWVAKQAWEIEDRAKTGPMVLARDRVRTLRRAVIDRGWQRGRRIGPALRWVGKHLP